MGAIASVGNKRYPMKNNLDPNDAIDRVLQATIRKHDPEALKRKKAELRKKKKLWKQTQEQAEQKKRIEAEKEEKAFQIERVRLMELREKRLAEQLEQMEISRKKHPKLGKKRT